MIILLNDVLVGNRGWGGEGVVEGKEKVSILFYLVVKV